jgi:UDP-N-acetyl-D-mannosaminuronic acid transferase (WecB/TagA/CpsF family)
METTVNKNTPDNDHAKFRQILGLTFFIGNTEQVVQRALGGGLVAVPSAPVLVELSRDAVHRKALLDADLVITDSGFMVLLWQLMTGERLLRVSGLGYLESLLRQPVLKEKGQTFWVMPQRASMERNLAWLKSAGFAATEDDCYLAPLYGKGELNDPELLKIIREKQPTHIFLCVGGNVQERLGSFLKRECGYRPGIHCIGAAIGFLSGDQVKIPMWADRFFLGWLFRSLSAPRRFLPRYWSALQLAPLLWKYREKLPVAPGR